MLEKLQISKDNQEMADVVQASEQHFRERRLADGMLPLKREVRR